MTAWWILLLCVSLSVIALWKPNYILGVVASASWMILLWFTRTTPLTGFVLGNTGDTILVLVLLGIAAGIILYTVLREISLKKSISLAGDNSSKEDNGMRRNASARPIGRESAEEYEARLYRTTHPQKR